MFCKNCGKKLDDRAKVCSQCGAPVRIQPGGQRGGQPVLPPGYPGGGKKKKSRTGLIIGIVVLVFLLLAGAGAAGYFLILRPGLEAGAAAEKETKEDAETAEGETLAEEAPGAESEGDGGQETQATLAEEETGDAASQGAAESTQADGGAGTFSSQGALSDSELARTIASYNTRGNSAVSIDVFEENFTPGTRNTSLAWDKTLFYTMEDIDPNSPADGLINGLDITRKMLTNAATGNQMEYEIYTNPSTGKVNKIVSIEYMEGYLEITDYYYDDNGRVSFIFIRNDINYIPSYAIPTKDGQRFYFNSDCMVKWRVVSNGVQANYVIGPESARQGGNASSSIFQYSTLEAGAKANYDQTEKRMINAAYNTYQKVLAARGVSEITGYVYDESGAPALNAQVVLVDDAANEKLYESKTDASGRYRVMVPSEDGVYRLVVSREDCVDATVYGIEISNQILADYQDAVYMVEKSDASYPVSVHMYDALNYAQDGNGMERLSNAAVYIRDGVNHKTGGVVAQATANVEGVVDVALPPGMYTAEVMKEGYDSTYYNFAARENMEAVQINASPRLAEGEVRIVLTWGSTPSDLDSHLFTPYDNTFGDSTYHIWYGNQRDAVGNNLDVDDTTSYGPETMTIPVLKNGLYKYYVADFTHCAGGDPTSFEMSNSGAMVNVYTSNGLTATFTVPANTSGVIWEVFELRNGSIVPIQRYYSNIDDKSWWHNDK